MRDKFGRFMKGHPKYTTKGDFQKGHKTWIKGLHPEYLQDKNHPNWKGGKIKDSNGYILILKRSHSFCNRRGYILEHRLVVEKQIDRYLSPTEHVHHINGIKTDNRRENLMAFKNNRAHKRFEMGGSVKLEEIIYDGRN